MYQPKLNLKFNPPLLYTESDTYYDQVIDALCQVYPDLKWYGGDPVKNYNPFLYDADFGDEDRGIHYLTIGYFEEQPDRLTYTDDEYMEYNNWINGYQWVEEHSVDYDTTTSMFDSLNESENDDLNLDKIIIIFEDTDSLNKNDLNLLLDFYSLHGYEVIWEESHKEEMLDYINNDERIKGSYPYIRVREGNRRLVFGDSITYGRRGYGDSYTPVPYKKFKEIFLNSDSLFDSLNESEEKDKYTQEDLEFFYKNGTLFYEISPMTNQPFPLDDWYKSRGMRGDEIGFYSVVGKTGNYYDVCWHKKNGLDCSGQGPNELIRHLNSGRLVPVEVYNLSYDMFDSLNESKSGVNKYKVGDRFLVNKDLNFDRGGRRFVTGGKEYEIVRIEYDHDWDDYGYTGDRYILQTDNKTREEADHGFSAVYLDKNFTYIPEGTNLDINFDMLYESENIQPFTDEDPIPIKYPQTGDYLLCHTDLVMEGDGIVEATKGQIYEITKTNINLIYIKDNSGDDHGFDKRGDFKYTKWFTHIPREYKEQVLNTDFFDNITEEVKNPPTVGRKVYMIMHDSGKYVMSKNLTYGVHWVDIDDYGNREYDDYNMITFKKEGKAEEMLRLVNQTWSERDRRISAYKLNADYIDRYNPSEWQVIEYTLGLIPQENLFESYERDFNYQNVQFNLIQNGKPNGITYTITGRCKPDWISQHDPDGWVVEWENPVPSPFNLTGQFEPKHMKTCIQLSSIIRSFSDGTYIPINLLTHDETDKLFTDLN